MISPVNEVFGLHPRFPSHNYLPMIRLWVLRYQPPRSLPPAHLIGLKITPANQGLHARHCEKWRRVEDQGSLISSRIAGPGLPSLGWLKPPRNKVYSSTILLKGLLSEARMQVIDIQT